MRTEILAIGTELLTTDRVDTNSVWLAQRLADLGLAFHRKTCLGDDPEDLRRAFGEALERSELIITSGGLGPTFDDLTKEIWAEHLGVPLLEDGQVRKDIEGFFLGRGRPMPPRNLKQALVPKGARVLRNPVGTAPGLLWVDPPGHEGSTVVMLPGVPREFKSLWETQVEPWLKARTHRPTHTLRLLVAGVGESLLEQRTEAIRQQHGHLDWTILASLGQVELVARHPDPLLLEAAAQDLIPILGADLVLRGPGTVASRVLDLLAARNETLALAESMTGGRIGALLTEIPGASRSFVGGAVVYSPEAKLRLAALPPAVLASHGTVSEATALALAEGIRDRLGSTWGLAVVGNAGPGEDPGGSAPVGTAWMAVAGPEGASAHPNVFPGHRADVQSRTSLLALDALRRRLEAASGC